MHGSLALRPTSRREKVPTVFRGKLFRSAEYPASPPKPEPGTRAFACADDARRFRRIHFPGWYSADGRAHATGRTPDAPSNGKPAQARRGVRHQDYCSSRATAGVKPDSTIATTVAR